MEATSRSHPCPQAAAGCVSKCADLPLFDRAQSLWLNENCIERIEGLEACTSLRRLFLYGNKIRRIEGLSSLRELEVLWLCDNRIAVRAIDGEGGLLGVHCIRLPSGLFFVSLCQQIVEGLEQLEGLRELSLARNRIERVGTALLANSNLQSLNLSCNLIGSFRELTTLAALPKLQAR